MKVRLISRTFQEMHSWGSSLI